MKTQDIHKEIVNFIRLTFKNEKGFIPLHEPVFIGNETKYLEECIRSTYVSYTGAYVTEFENKVCEYTGTKFAVATVNGTSALQAALITAGVKKNTEVITQALTFAATANAIVHAGGEPVFIDSDIQSFGMSEKALENFLEENCFLNDENKCINRNTNKEITACVPVHIFGHPCRIDKISEICKTWNLSLVEDAAESLGSFYKGKHTGTYGKAGILSFNGNKIITTGGGGMILTNDEQFYNEVKHLATTAKVSHPYEFIHNKTGYNYRMPNLNAAVGLAQLENIEYFLKSKRELFKTYDNFFNKMSIDLLEEPENAYSNYWLNAVRFNSPEERITFLEYSYKNGIGCRAVWKLIPELDMYSKCIKDKLENSSFIYQRYVNIPSSVRLK